MHSSLLFTANDLAFPRSPEPSGWTFPRLPEKQRYVREGRFSLPADEPLINLPDSAAVVL